MKKTDADLKRDIEAELAWDPAVTAPGIGVSVKDGVATLSGHIDTFAEKWAVEKALRRVQGVKAIAMELDVRLAPTHQRGDTDIARAAQSALEWNTTLPPAAVRVVVDNGWITLQGDVDWNYQRRNAESTVRHLFGVVGVSNEIRLRQKPTVAGLKSAIEDALKRQAVQEAGQVQVAVGADGKVTLSGRVNSWHERDAAQQAAWSAAGVNAVVNNLAIG